MESWRPSEAEIEHYREHGWLVTPPVLCKAVLEDAEFGAARFYEGERDWKLPVAGGFLDWTPAQGPGLRINDYISLQNIEINNLVRQPIIGAIAAHLTGSQVIRLFHDQMICKPPGEVTPVGWHVDLSYWKTCTEAESMLTAWIPFQDCSVDLGTLTIIDRSHSWVGNEWMSTFTESDLDSLETRFITNGDSVIKVPLLLNRGQMSFHHSRAIHGGTANVTSVPRLALAVHLQPGSNQYKPAADSMGKPIVHMNDLLCRKNQHGLPDYTDPEICPTLWSR